MFPASQLFLYLTQPEPVTQPLTMFPEPQPFIYLTQPVTQHLTMFPESQLFIYLTQPVTRSTLDNVSRVTTVYLLDSTCNSTFDNVFKVTTVYLLDSSCDNVSMMTTVCLPDDSPFATNSTATPVSPAIFFLARLLLLAAILTPTQTVFRSLPGSESVIAEEKRAVR